MSEVAVVPSTGRKRGKNQRRTEELEVMRLKVLGWRDVDIASHLSMSIATVHRRLNAALAEQKPLEVGKYREQHKQTLEVLMRQSMPGIEVGDPAAIANGVRIVDRLAKLLGTDAPQQVETTVTVVTPQERELSELLAQAERDAAMREADIAEGVEA